MTDRRRYPAHFSLMAVIVVGLGVLFSPAPAAASDYQLDELTGTDSPASVSPVDKERVRETIEGLETEKRTSQGTYDREAQYGEWESNEGSADEAFCGSTREDIRQRDLSKVVLKSDDECAVESGTLTYEPYTGQSVDFIRSPNPSLQVEHIVPVELHYDMIGYGLTQEEREEFNNDPENLILVDGSANGSKGSAGPGEWMVPDNPAYACTYVARFSYVANKYTMPVDPADKKAMLTTIDHCDNTATVSGENASAKDQPLSLIQDHPIVAAVVIIVALVLLAAVANARSRRSRRRSGTRRAVKNLRRVHREAKRWGL